MTDTDEPVQPESDASAQQAQPEQLSQEQATVPDESENAQQYLNWVGRSFDLNEIVTK
jgi:hypothetical protein